VQNDNDKIRERQRKALLLTTLLNHNYLHLIFWYWLVDVSSIFPTGFEIYIYSIVLTYHSFAYTMFKIIEKYVADVIDPKISFTPTITLQQDFQFRDRLYKLGALMYFLKMSATIYILNVLWILWSVDSFQGSDQFNGLMHIIFLTYPAFVNYFEFEI
jgi:hypothetical protein